MTILNKQDKHLEDVIKSISNAFTHVETFNQRMHDLDFEVDTANLSRDKFLPDMLSFAMTQWELNNDFPNTVTCLLLIKRAILLGMIKEGQGLVNKIKTCSEENIKLKKELERVNMELIDVKTRNKELEQLMTPHYTGDVE